MEYAQQVASFLATLTVAGQLIALATIVELLRTAGGRKSSRLLQFIGKRGLVLMLTVALTATLGSLYFSDIAGWTPCKLCWYQRIFLYPQTILLLVALWRKDRTIAASILVLSVIGLLIAFGHYTEQVNAALHPIDPLVPCDSTGTSCAATPFFRYGYITIPMMAATAFLLNAVGSLVMLRRKV